MTQITPKINQYALWSVFELARHQGQGPTKVSHIAEVQAIPARLPEVILHGNRRQSPTRVFQTKQDDPLRDSARCNNYRGSGQPSFRFRVPQMRGEIVGLLRFTADVRSGGCRFNQCSILETDCFNIALTSTSYCSTFLDDYSRLIRAVMQIRRPYAKY